MAVGALAVSPAAADPLEVKPGLWDVTAEGAGGGALSALPQILAGQLSKLTPAQQAKIQSYIAAAGVAGGAALERRVCVTPVLLRNPLSVVGGPHNCSLALVGSSATTLELQVSCAGEHRAGGTLRLTASDPRTVNGMIDVQLTAKDGSTIAVHRALRGNWIATDCGGVRSVE